MSLQLLGVAPLLLAWTGWYWIARELAARGKIAPPWQLSWALACLAWGGSLLAITELTSWGGNLTAGGVALCWTLLSLASLSLAAALAQRRGQTPAALLRSLLRAPLPNAAQTPLDIRFMRAGTGLIIAILGGIALATPTTNGDSLTYHLPRVMHWIQNGTVDHFPTGNCRQNEFGPWAGYVVTHLHLLAGGDRLSNLVQWFSMLNAVLLGAFLASRFVSLLGGVSSATAARASALTGLLLASLPIGIVQSITTQTDYCAASWLLVLILFILQLREAPGNLWYSLGAGAAFGLGTLTKVTTLLYAGPLVAALVCWLTVRQSGWRTRFQAPAMMALLFVLANGLHMSRNFALAGSPFSCPYILAVERNETIGLGPALSNLIRNLNLHSYTGLAPLTRGLQSSLEAAHGLTGQDPNNPATTYHGTRFQFRTRFDLFDSYASCFPHLLVILVAGLLALTRPRRFYKPLLYAALIAAGAFLFCAMLRWQPWHSRIHLGFFTGLIPCAGAVLATAPRWTCWVAAPLLVHAALFTTLNNRSRPVLDPNFLSLQRERQYGRVHAQHVYEPSARAIRDIIDSGASRIGLRLGFNDPEYLIWVLLRENGYQGRIDHYLPFDASAKLAKLTAQPDVLITSWEQPMPAQYTNGYPHRVDYGWLKVLWSDETPPPQRVSQADHSDARPIN